MYLLLSVYVSCLQLPISTVNFIELNTFTYRYNINVHSTCNFSCPNYKTTQEFQISFFPQILALFSPAKIHTRAEKVQKCKWKLKQKAKCQICIALSPSPSLLLSSSLSGYRQMTQLTENERTKQNRSKIK